MAGTKGRSGGNRTPDSDQTPVDGLPVRPEGKSDRWNAKWDELLTQLPAAVLRRIDAHQLKGLTTLLVDEDVQSARLEADPGDMKGRRVYLNTIQSIGRLSALFGLSPADRARLKIEPAEQPSEFEEFLRRRMNRRA